MDLRISLRKLEVLSLVVQLGGVGRAAEYLFVSQPVVTAHVRSLEERLGTKLFYREGHTMHLTEAGVEVHAWAEDVLTKSRELERSLASMVDGSKGTVAFGASMSIGCYVLPSVLSSFGAENPGADLRLSIADTEHAVEDTRTGELDFAVVVSDRESEFPGMELEEVGRDDVVLVSAVGDGQVADKIALEDLKDLRFVDAPQGVVRRTFIDQQLRKLGVVDRDVALELGHPEALKRAAWEGVGVTFLLRSAVTIELEQGLLREIEVDGVEMVFPIFVVYRKEKTLSPLHRKLIESISTSLQ